MNKEVLRLAGPNILSNISVPLLSTVDTYLMGHLSTEHLGAVGIGAMIFNMFYWNFGFLRMGTTGMTAQAYGREDNKAIKYHFARACFLAISIGLALWVLVLPIEWVSFSLMNVLDNQYDLVQSYFYIRMVAAPATLALYAIFGWFFGMQNAYYPLILTIAINIINMVLSYILVINFDYGIQGVAWGTVIAQYAGLLFAIFLMLFKYRSFLTDIRFSEMIQIEAFKDFLSINKDIFLRSIFLTIAFAFFYSQSSEGGELVLAGNYLLLLFLNWMSYGIDGFAYASESLVGKYFGAKNEAKLSQAIKLSFIWALFVALIFTITYWLFGVELLRLFTDQEDLVEFTKPYLIWMIILPIIGFPSYIWDGVFIGLTASKAMRDSMLVSFVLYLGTFYLMSEFPIMSQLWMSLLIFLAARGIVQTWMFYRKGTKLK